MEIPIGSAYSAPSPQRTASSLLSEWFTLCELLFVATDGTFLVFSERITAEVRLRADVAGKLTVSISFELRCLLSDRTLRKISMKAARCSPSQVAMVTRKKTVSAVATAYREQSGFSLNRFRETFCTVAAACLAVLDATADPARSSRDRNLR
jgi:hypothetical protein